MNFPLFIAKRIFASQDAKQKVSKPAIRIATAGVAIGLAVMIISERGAWLQAYRTKQGHRLR